MSTAAQDLRYQKTKKLILDAMVRLLRHENFDQITVKKICQEAGISRGAFYAHYYDKYDLVEQFQMEIIQKGNRLFTASEALDVPRLMMTMLHLLVDEGQLLALLISDHGSIEVQNKLKGIMRENAAKIILPLVTTEIAAGKEQKYILSFLSNAVFGVLQEWVNSGQQETPEELVRILAKVIPKFNFVKDSVPPVEL